MWKTSQSSCLNFQNIRTLDTAWTNSVKFTLDFIQKSCFWRKNFLRPKVPKNAEGAQNAYMGVLRAVDKF